jgi:hypothetical protein
MAATVYRSFARFLFLFFPFCATAQSLGGSDPFTDRTPAYFVDHYGRSTSSKNVSKYIFLQPGRGNVDIKGQFSIREFKRGDLRVEAYFTLPALKLAAVKLSLPHIWTLDQISAALTAYGTGWKRVDKPGTEVWTTPDGLRAIFLLSSLEIQSPAIVQDVEQTSKDNDAKRKAIPKF